MTILCNRSIPPDQPAIHVLIVAVGDYPYLENGTATTLYTKLRRVGQLSSPPISAMRVIDWLRTDYAPLDGTLATIDILCSGAGCFEDDHGDAIDVERATMDNVRARIAAWHARGNNKEEDTLIFMFCGHGIAGGGVTSLLLENFGDFPLDPFSTAAIAAEDFLNGMRACKALKQLYFLDACRYEPTDYVEEFGNSQGIPVVRASMHNHLGRSRQVCIWSSKLGSSAFGQPNGPTVFTEAFLDAMRGAGARQDEDGNGWVIQGSALIDGINFLVKRKYGTAKQYATPGFMSEGFPFHVLSAPPNVPVNVLCKPANQSQFVKLSCDAQTALGPQGPWHLELSYGQYLVRASRLTDDEQLDEQPCLAAPPFVIVNMAVGG